MTISDAPSTRSAPAAAPRPALILVAHGAPNFPQSAQLLFDLARAVEQRGLFAEVKAVFMKGEPQAARAVSLVAARPIVVVPMFMGRGYYTDVLVPKALGVDADTSILYTPPVGTHPAMPLLLMKHVLKTAISHTLIPASTLLYLVAHGSSRPGGSGDTAYAIAQTLRRITPFKRVELGFIEQEPKAEFWRDKLPESDVIILPLLAATGAHASLDMPRIFGFGAGDPLLRSENGRRVVLAESIGGEPDLVDLVVELATCHYDGSKYPENVLNQDPNVDTDSTVVSEPAV